MKTLAAIFCVVLVACSSSTQPSDPNNPNNTQGGKTWKNSVFVIDDSTNGLHRTILLDSIWFGSYIPHDYYYTVWGHDTSKSTSYFLLFGAHIHGDTVGTYPMDDRDTTTGSVNIRLRVHLGDGYIGPDSCTFRLLSMQPFHAQGTVWWYYGLKRMTFDLYH